MMYSKGIRTMTDTAKAEPVYSTDYIFRWPGVEMNVTTCGCINELDLKACLKEAIDALSNGLE